MVVQILSDKVAIYNTHNLIILINNIAVRRILVEIQYKYLYYNFIRTNLVRAKSIVLLN